MKPAPFDYRTAGSVAEAVQALAEADGDAKIIAGGQSLTPVLAMRMAHPALLVDINRIPGLAEITGAGDGVLRIGAIVRHARLAEQHVHPLLAEAARWIGHTAIRSRGTAGGSIAHADPAAELPVVAAALDATVHIAGQAGERETGTGDLFAGVLQTTLADDEMITAIDLPVPSRWGFAELARRHGDFGLVVVAVTELAGCWRIAIGGVGGVPYRAAEAEAVLTDGPITTDRLGAAAAAAAAGLEPASDIHATAGYRRAMAEEFTLRALRQATGVPARGAA
jgi:carbon-monoxide dehydrogenase medium subunit